LNSQQQLSKGLFVNGNRNFEEKKEEIKNVSSGVEEVKVITY
jgi:hypothetical protein